MITSYRDKDCCIEVEHKRSTDDELKLFLDSIPFKIVLFDKNNKAYQHISNYDNITNIYDLRRTYNAKTYIVSPIEFDSNVGLKIASNNENNDGVIVISRRYIRTNYPYLKIAPSAEVTQLAKELCNDFLNNSALALIHNEHYNVVLIQGNDKQCMNIIYANDNKALQRYVAKHIYFSDPCFKSLIPTIK